MNSNTARIIRFLNLPTLAAIAGLIIAGLIAVNSTRADALICPSDKGAAITSGYGPRGGGFHAGIDINVKDRPAIASVGGTATPRTNSGGGGYGYYMDLHGDDGRVYRYGHLYRDGRVSGRVEAGQKIGTTDNSGSSTGSHLHWEIRTDGGGFGGNGTIDPAGEYNSCGAGGGSSPAPVGGGEAPCSHPTIDRNNTGGGNCVRHLQQHLNKFGYGLGVDGAWGDKTDNAVRDFQRKQGFSGSGVVGPTTWARLHESSAPDAPASSAPSGQPPASPGGYYKVRAIDFNARCVDANSSENYENGAINQHFCISGANNQLIKIIDKGSGYYQMQFLYNGLCAAVLNRNQNNGEFVVQSSCGNNTNQQVKLVPRGGDKFSLQFRHSNKCLDFNSSPQENRDGGKVQQWDCHDGSNQRFALLPRDATDGTGGGSVTPNTPPQNSPPGGSSGAPSGDQNLVVKGKCMDVRGSSSANGAQIQQWACVGVNNQKFRFESKGGGYYQLVARHSNKCVDVHPNELRNGGTIHQWSCHGGDNQLFSLQSIGGGRYLIKAKAGGRCIDSPYANNGDKLHQWSCDANNINQKFSFSNSQGGNTQTPPANKPPVKNTPPQNTPPQNPPPSNNTPPSNAPQNPSGTRYKVRSAYNLRCVDAHPGENRDGGKIHQWDCISDAANQLIRLNPKGNGWYEMQFQYGDKRCVDVYGFGKNAGASIVQWKCNGKDNQLVRKIYKGKDSYDSFYRLEFKHAPGMCLDFDNRAGRNGNGGVVHLWTCHEGTNQRFYLLPR
jgi:hypothetical protein